MSEENLSVEKLRDELVQALHKATGVEPYGMALRLNLLISATQMETLTGMLGWVQQRLQEEVANRPKKNVAYKTLEAAWWQVVDKLKLETDRLREWIKEDLHSEANRLWGARDDQ